MNIEVGEIYQAVATPGHLFENGQKILIISESYHSLTGKTQYNAEQVNEDGSPGIRQTLHTHEIAPLEEMEVSTIYKDGLPGLSQLELVYLLEALTDAYTDNPGRPDYQKTLKKMMVLASEELGRRED